MPGNEPVSRRDVELALIEKIDSRLDSLSEDMRDVRDRVIRIEAQDVNAKVFSLEQRVSGLELWKSRVMGQIALVVVPIAATVGAFIKVAIDLIAK